MKETIKLGLILFIITMISAGVLAVSNNATKDKIAEIEMMDSINALKEIFGDKEFEAIEEERLSTIKEANKNMQEIFEIYDGGKLTGYAVKMKSKGFSSGLITITGISVDGNTMGVQVVDHSETQGIGTNAMESVFLDEFINQSTEDDIIVDVVSGATYTSKGIMAGVNEAIEVFRTQLSD